MKRNVFGKYTSFTRKVTNNDDLKQGQEQFLNKRKDRCHKCLCHNQIWTTFGDNAETEL